MKSKIPKQSQLMIPLLKELSALGGAATPNALYDRVAKHVNLDDETRNQKVVAAGDGQITNEFERQVRWTRQTAVCKGLIDNAERGIWALTDKAKANLHNAVSGIVITIYETDAGYALWGNAHDVAGFIEPGSLQVICESPPYALERRREYLGQLGEHEWVEDMLRRIERYLPLLTSNGSVFLNVGPTWRPGLPIQKLCVERLLVRLEDTLGVHLLQELHVQTAGLGGGFEWVSKRRLRVRPNIEKLLWLSPNPYERGNNRNVLKPYAPSSLRAIANPNDHAGRRRPSGYTFGKNSFIDNGGAIPSTLIQAPNSGGRNAYRTAMRAAGREPHSATFAEAVPEFAIRIASDPGDTIGDLTAGSGTTGVVAQKLGRRFIIGDIALKYVQDSRIRFHSAGFDTRDVAKLSA